MITLLLEEDLIKLRIKLTTKATIVFKKDDVL